MRGLIVLLTFLHPYSVLMGLELYSVYGICQLVSWGAPETAKTQMDGFLGYDAQPCTLCNHIVVSPNILMHIVFIGQMRQLNKESTHPMNLGQQTQRGCFTQCSKGNGILYLPCILHQTCTNTVIIISCSPRSEQHLSVATFLKQLWLSLSFHLSTKLWLIPNTPVLSMLFRYPN